jgi:hypothetical protein
VQAGAADGQGKALPGLVNKEVPEISSCDKRARA